MEGHKQYADVELHKPEVKGEGFAYIRAKIWGDMPPPHMHPGFRRPCNLVCIQIVLSKDTGGSTFIRLPLSKHKPRLPQFLQGKLLED